MHIGDRESDIYELFCTAQDVGTHFLVRTCVDRLAGDGNRTYPDAVHEKAMTLAEIDPLDCCLLKDSKRSRVQLPLSRYLKKIAQLGGDGN